MGRKQEPAAGEAGLQCRPAEDSADPRVAPEQGWFFIIVPSRGSGAGPFGTHIHQSLDASRNGECDLCEGASPFTDATCLLASEPLVSCQTIDETRQGFRGWGRCRPWAGRAHRVLGSWADSWSGCQCWAHSLRPGPRSLCPWVQPSLVHWAEGSGGTSLETDCERLGCCPVVTSAIGREEVQL